jgi:hypothetical protein
LLDDITLLLAVIMFRHGLQVVLFPLRSRFEARKFLAVSPSAKVTKTDPLNRFSLVRRSFKPLTSPNWVKKLSSSN